MAVRESKALQLLEERHAELLELFARSEPNELEVEINEFRALAQELEAWASQNGMAMLADQAEYRDWYWEARQYSDTRFKISTMPERQLPREESPYLGDAGRLAACYLMTASRLLTWRGSFLAERILATLRTTEPEPFPLALTSVHANHVEALGRTLEAAPEIVRDSVVRPALLLCLKKWRAELYGEGSLETLWNLAHRLDMVSDRVELVTDLQSSVWLIGSPGRDNGSTKIRLPDLRVDDQLRRRLMRLAYRLADMTRVKKKLERLAAA